MFDVCAIKIKSCKRKSRGKPLLGGDSVAKQCIHEPLSCDVTFEWNKNPSCLCSSLHKAMHFQKIHCDAKFPEAISTIRFRCALIEYCHREYVTLNLNIVSPILGSATFSLQQLMRRIDNHMYDFIEYSLTSIHYWKWFVRMLRWSRWLRWRADKCREYVGTWTASHCCSKLNA